MNTSATRGPTSTPALEPNRCRSHHRDFASLAGLSSAPDETMLTPRDVTALLGNSRETLRRWKRNNAGPPVSLLQGRPRYRLGDLRNWLAAA